MSVRTHIKPTGGSVYIKGGPTTTVIYYNQCPHCGAKLTPGDLVIPTGCIVGLACAHCGKHITSDLRDTPLNPLPSPHKG